MEQFEVVLSIVQDLTAAISSKDRRARLLAALRRVIPYDAAAVGLLDGDALVLAASHGLVPDALARRYPLSENPRLAAICRAEGPIRFAPDSPLPDPFDGLLADGTTARVHSCLGCPLRVNGRLLGVLTADARAPEAFAGLDLRFLAAVAALAAAELETTRLIEALERTAARQGLIARDLQRDAEERGGSQLIGTSAAMARLRRDLEVVARSDYPVLILGETGTGKELVARALHAGSLRRAEPLLYVNCAALPESLADAELFGHTRGAFTGADADRPGKFEVADGGTLLLDEIGELALSVQPKLLRVLQQGELQRVGAARPSRVDVRILAATNRDLAGEVAAGRFRADLYHRLNVCSLTVPPLRQRAEDIPLLAGYFGDLARRRLGCGPVRLAPEAVDALLAYPWPGNVRELENIVARVVLKAAAELPRGETVVLGAVHLASELGSSSVAAPGAATVGSVPAGVVRPLAQAVRDLQRELIRTALDECGGTWAAAARRLGLHRSNLHHLARRLGLR